jgi:hypothetical protein
VFNVALKPASSLHSFPVTAEERIALEMLVLTALCAASGKEARAGVTSLAAYSWMSADAAAMFSAIRSALARNARLDRETLTSTATREGFPDLDWESVLAPMSRHDDADLASLIAQACVAMKAQPLTHRQV